MRKRLRVPLTLAFAITGTTAAVSAAAGLLVTSCDATEPPKDGSVSCMLFCIPDGTDAGVCPEPAPCADAGNCPSGCTPVG